jgi:transcription factor Opi1
VSKRGGSGGGDVGEGGGENARVPAGTAFVAAQRISAWATESLDMMRNVTGVMKDMMKVDDVVDHCVVNIQIQEDRHLLLVYRVEYQLSVDGRPIWIKI